jgi:dynein heavy chain
VCSQVILRFLDTQNSLTLLYYLNNREDLMVADETNFPHVLKKKSIYFYKSPLVQVPLDKERMLTDIESGELSSSPLEFLSCLLEEVYLPMLSNPKNMQPWPEVVASDVLRHFHRLSGAVYVISGQAKVRTCPLKWLSVF